jgi:ABC-type transport system involved in Fe-S cluster assembly fused permease/ATPase subunit
LRSRHRLRPPRDLPLLHHHRRQHRLRRQRTRPAPEQDIEAAAATAHIASEILEGFPAQFHTIVGERGMTLSGGQKQRTAIARAILRDPRILILDDALASVDTNTEDQILTNLRDPPCRAAPPSSSPTASPPRATPTASPSSS